MSLKPEEIQRLFSDLGSEIKEHTAGEIKKAVEAVEGGVEEKLNELRTHVDERVGKVEERTKSRAVSLPGVEDEQQKFSFSKALHAIATKDWSEARFEEDVFKQTRALSQGTDSAGGYIVPNQYLPELIELLRSNTVVQQMGATVMDGLTGSPVQIPRQTGGVSGSWVGENAAISDEDQTFDELTLTPKQASSMTKMSNRLLRLSNPSAEGIVRRDLALAIARLIDLAALRGSGSSNEPEGIVNVSGINTVTKTPATIAYADLQACITALDEDNALRGSLGWVFHPAIREDIANLLDANNNPLFVPLAQAGNVQTQREGGVVSSLLGYPWATTTQLPTNLGGGTETEVFFCNWDELIIAHWGGLELMASQETSDAFEKNQTWVRIIYETDIGVRHPVSFCVHQDITT